MASIFEAKYSYSKASGSERLQELAEQALRQINIKAYETEMHDNGADRIIKLGIAFSGKDVAILAERYNYSENYDFRNSYISIPAILSPCTTCELKIRSADAGMQMASGFGSSDKTHF